MMTYASIPGVEKPVSRILFGTSLPVMRQGADCNRLLDEVLELGITTFDTARVYEGAEEVLGRWIASRKNRDNIVLLTKCAHHDVVTGIRRVTPEDIRADFERSAKALGTDYFDIYLLHRDDPGLPVGPIVEALNDLHREGKVGAFGGSNWTHHRIREANEYARDHGLIPFSLSSPQFSLARQTGPSWEGCITITGPEQEAARSWYAQSGMPVVSYSSLANGFLSGKLRSFHQQEAGRYLHEDTLQTFSHPENYERLRRCEAVAAQKGATVSQVALAWMLCQDMQVFPIITSSRSRRMEENIGACRLQLTDRECRYLNLQAENL